ncbi:MAG: tRNA lysidine(34) synthetase TilS [bacterium]
MKKLSVAHQFLETVKEYRLFRDKSRVLVAVSGGADSVCLLDLLRIVAPKLNLKLYGIHINHGLRETAQRDEMFVRRLFESWGGKLTVVRADVRGYARRHRLGFEEAARCLRYYHFQRAAKKLRCDTVALGHTADDNLETVILNLVRGTGLRGLGGIPIRRDIFVRPLLRIDRESIRGYLKARGIGWVEDETNNDIRFRRNLVRQQVVPVLKKLNPAVRENVLRSCAFISSEDIFLDFLASRVLERIGKLHRTIATIDIKEFNDYNYILRRRMVRLVVPELDSTGVERVLKLCEKGCQGRHQLKAGIEISITKDELKMPVRVRRSADGG